MHSPNETTRGELQPRGRRFRFLIVERLEERRLLAIAADDHYVVNMNDTLTVNGLGTWSNDSYNESCLTSYWDGGNQVWYSNHASGGITSLLSLHGSLRPDIGLIPFIPLYAPRTIG